MKLEVLVSTMNQVDFTIVEKMNIKTDAIIVNQCDINGYDEYEDCDKRIRMYHFNERGVGLSRNNALMRSTADICVMADDDVEYVDDYKNIVINAFEENPRADMIMFNVPEPDKSPYRSPEIKNEARVNFTNFMRYGTFNIALRRESVVKANVCFSLLFGGGARYSCGEDTIFISDCLKNGLNIYSSTAKIGIVRHDKSTWFKGYDDKYFFDRGVLFAALSKRMSYLLILQFAVRKYNMYKTEISAARAVGNMIKGSRSF